MRKLLIPLLVIPTLLAGAAGTKKLPKDKKALHAINRLTFGPRPGDLETVQKIGLKKWIDLQLHPDRIVENPELLARLKPLDTLQMSTAVMNEHYPTQQMLAAMARMDSARKEDILPKDPILRARFERMAEVYKRRIARQG